jgi:hypothetical protein
LVTLAAVIVIRQSRDGKPDQNIDD